MKKYSPSKLCQTLRSPVGKCFAQSLMACALGSPMRTTSWRMT
jgi:hypothetical protein